MNLTPWITETHARVGAAPASSDLSAYYSPGGGAARSRRSSRRPCRRSARRAASRSPFRSGSRSIDIAAVMRRDYLQLRGSRPCARARRGAQSPPGCWSCQVHSAARGRSNVRTRRGPGSFVQAEVPSVVAALTSRVAILAARQIVPSCQPQSGEQRALMAPESTEPAVANNGHIVAGQKDAVFAIGRIVSACAGAVFHCFPGEEVQLPRLRHERLDEAGHGSELWRALRPGGRGRRSGVSAG